MPHADRLGPASASTPRLVGVDAQKCEVPRFAALFRNVNRPRGARKTRRRFFPGFLPFFVPSADLCL